MEIFANQVANELSEEFEEYRKPYGLKPSVIGDTRYAIFKVGPVLISSHGMVCLPCPYCCTKSPKCFITEGY